MKTRIPLIFFWEATIYFFIRPLELDYSLNHDQKNEDSVHRLTMIYRIMDDLKLEISTVYFDPSDSSSGILSHYLGKSRLSAGMTIIFRKLFKLSEPVISFPKIDILENQFWKNFQIQQLSSNSESSINFRVFPTRSSSEKALRS